MNEIIRVEGLTKNFTKKGFFKSKSDKDTASENVSFSLNDNEMLAMDGQSGSGKSTIAHIILRTIDPDSGTIYYEGAKDDSNS